MFLFVVFQSAPANDESNYHLVILNAAIQSPDSKRKFFLFKLSIRQKFVAEEFKNLATLWKETTKHLKEIR